MARGASADTPPDEVDRIESLAEQADFDHAEAAATLALLSGDLSPAAAGRVYVVLGTIAAARGKPEDAEAFFHKALVLSPRASLPPSAGPHVRASFSRARTAVAEEEAASAPPVPPQEPAPSQQQPASSLEPPPAEQPAGVAREVRARPIPASVWIAGATTGGLAVATVILGVSALERRSTYEQANGDPQQTVSGRNALRESALTWEHAATIAMAAAFASAALTTILYVDRPVEVGHVALSAVPTPTGGTLVLSGRF